MSQVQKWGNRFACILNKFVSAVLLDLLDFSMFTMLGNIMVQYVYNKEE